MQSWADAELVHQPSENCLEKPDRVQGHRRNQYRRPVAGSGCLVASGHPLHALAMLKTRVRHQADEPGQNRPDQATGALPPKAT